MPPSGVPQSKCSVLCVEVSIKEWTLAPSFSPIGWPRALLYVDRTKSAVCEYSRNSSGGWRGKKQLPLSLYPLSEFPLKGLQYQDFLIWTGGQCNISQSEDSSVQHFRWSEAAGSSAGSLFISSQMSLVSPLPPLPFFPSWTLSNYSVIFVVSGN